MREGVEIVREGNACFARGTRWIYGKRAKIYRVEHLPNSSSISLPADHPLPPQHLWPGDLKVDREHAIAHPSNPPIRI